VLESVLVANTGEIARRIRTCRRLGIRSVAVYSAADAGLPYVSEADQAVELATESPEHRRHAQAHRAATEAVARLVEREP
jgi:acetyl-CoA carboxylase biotin carboxylase subunit